MALTLRVSCLHTGVDSQKLELLMSPDLPDSCTPPRGLRDPHQTILHGDLAVQAEPLGFSCTFRRSLIWSSCGAMVQQHECQLIIFATTWPGAVPILLATVFSRYHDADVAGRNMQDLHACAPHPTFRRHIQLEDQLRLGHVYWQLTCLPELAKHPFKQLELKAPNSLTGRSPGQRLCDGKQGSRMVVSDARDRKSVV